jgi:hypothetical protein
VFRHKKTHTQFETVPHRLKKSYTFDCTENTVEMNCLEKGIWLHPTNFHREEGYILHPAWQPTTIQSNRPENGITVKV